jgi:hypothetical protein
LNYRAIRRALPLALCLALTGLLTLATVRGATGWTAAASSDLVKADFISQSGSSAQLYLENHVSFEPFNSPEAGAVLDALGFGGGYSQEVSWSNDSSGPTAHCPDGLTDLLSFCNADAHGGWAIIPDGLRTELTLSASGSGDRILQVKPGYRSLAYDVSVASIGIALEVVSPNPGVIGTNAAHVASLAMQLAPEAGGFVAAAQREDYTAAGFELLSLSKRAAQVIADHITDWAIGGIVDMNPTILEGKLLLKIAQADTALVNLDAHLLTANSDTTVTLGYAGGGSGSASGPASSGLALPFNGPWYLTGGPHFDGLSNGVRYALDFAPIQAVGCPGGEPLTNVTAVDDGTGASNGTHSVVEITGSDGLTTGYMHLANISVHLGQQVTQGTPLGNPSCEMPKGGSTTGIHLHFYLMRAGQPVAIAGTVLGGWTVQAAVDNYQGTMVKSGQTRTADTGRCTVAKPCGSVVNEIGNGAAVSGLPPISQWRWKATSAPPYQWWSYDPTMLDDGRVVLLDDGFGGNPYAGMCVDDVVGNGLPDSFQGEAFDPNKGTWQQLPDSTLVGQSYGAQPVPHGQLLVLGVNPDANGDPGVTAAELYDAATNSWSAVPAPIAFNGYGIASLRDGRVVLLGGYDKNEQLLSTVQAFDPATGKWSLLGSLPQPMFARATVLPDGRILLVGGDPTSSFVYDPSNGRSAAAPLPSGTQSVGSLTALSDGRVVAVSGPVDGAIKTYAFDPKTSAWSAGLSATVPWTASTLVLRNGTLLVVGGLQATGSCENDNYEVVPLTTVTALDLATGHATTLAPLPQASEGTGLFELSDGRILSIGAEVDILGP